MCELAELSRGEIKMQDKCQICSEKRVKDSVYCEKHLLAYENLKKQYPYWKNAFQISWQEYLRRVAENENTGQWAKEVADYLIKRQTKSD